MDKISLAGIAIGLFAIIGGQILEGGHVGSLVQPTALLIVLGGTLGAVLLQSPDPHLQARHENGQVGLGAAGHRTEASDRPNPELEPTLAARRPAGSGEPDSRDQG